MKNPHDNYWVPDDGYKYISNGETWTNSIYLGAGVDINAWHDTNEEPPEPGTDDPTGEADYIKAAKILLGVSQ